MLIYLMNDTKTRVPFHKSSRTFDMSYLHAKNPQIHFRTLAYRQTDVPETEGIGLGQTGGRWVECVACVAGFSSWKEWQSQRIQRSHPRTYPRLTESGWCRVQTPWLCSKDEQQKVWTILGLVNFPKMDNKKRLELNAHLRLKNFLQHFSLAQFTVNMSHVTMKS